MGHNWSIIIRAVGMSLDALHGFKLAESLHGVDMLLLRCPLDLSVGIIRLLSLDKGLLLRSFHFPRHGRKVQ